MLMKKFTNKISIDQGLYDECVEKKLIPTLTKVIFARYRKNRGIKMVNTYINPYHNNNIYLDMNEFDILDNETIDEIQRKHSKPLQCMISSYKINIINNLQDLGFECKRKCYEMEVSIENLDDSTKSIEFIPIYSGEKGDGLYLKSSKLMYKHYSDTHKDINPLSMTLTEFYHLLPEKVYYINRDSKINCAAFAENNEIAYICSINGAPTLNFIKSLLIELFKEYEKISFEADDTDWVASMLKGMFKCENQVTYNTYIKY